MKQKLFYGAVWLQVPRLETYISILAACASISSELGSTTGHGVHLAGVSSTLR